MTHFLYLLFISAKFFSKSMSNYSVSLTGLLPHFSLQRCQSLGWSLIRKTDLSGISGWRVSRKPSTGILLKSVNLVALNDRGRTTVSGKIERFMVFFWFMSVHIVLTVLTTAFTLGFVVVLSCDVILQNWIAVWRMLLGNFWSWISKSCSSSDCSKSILLTVYDRSIEL